MRKLINSLNTKNAQLLFVVKNQFNNVSNIRWWVLGLLVVAMVNSYIDRGNISMVAPLITDLFELDAQKKGYIFSSFLLGYAIMQIPWVISR